MYQPDPLPKVPRQIWTVIALGLVLLALFVPVALGKAPAWRRPLPRARAAARLEQVAPPTEAPATLTGQTALGTETPTPAETASPTMAPSSTPQATPTVPPREDHYWLQRPLAATHNDAVARTYPYASRQDGTYPVHHGVEFVNPMGTEILAVADGTILVAGDDERQVYGARDGFYGLLVIQRIEGELYGLPVYVLYGHLSEIGVSVGQRVAAGEVIGEVGMSGYAEGPHVHVEVRVGRNDYGRTVNPELWLQPRPGHGTLAGRVVGADGQALPEVRLTLFRGDTPVRYVSTYPAHQVNADPAWGENFATGDLPAGDYVVHTFLGNQLYTFQVHVTAGQTTWLAVGGR